MIETAPEQAPEPRYDPDKVSTASFDVVRRGFNEGQVRQFLRDLADSLRAAYRAEDKLRASIADLDAKLVDASVVDEHLLTERLGAEAAAILNTARDAASTRLGEAEAEAEHLATTSHDDANAMLGTARDEADQLAAESRERAESLVAEAEARAAELVSEAQGIFDLRSAEADAEAARRVAAVNDEVAERRAEGERLIAEAKQQGRVLLIEAKHHREQLLHNLEQRRRRMRDQIERLQAGRDRLLEAYDVVQRTIDTARHDLKVALPEAKIAGDRASRRLEEDLPRAIEALESELDDARRAGLLGDLDLIAAEAAAAGGVELPLAAPLPDVEPEPEAVDAEPEPEVVDEVVDAEPKPEAVDAEPKPEAVDAEPEPEVVDAEPEPEVVDEAVDAEPAAPTVSDAASLFQQLRAERRTQVIDAEATLAAADSDADSSAAEVPDADESDPDTSPAHDLQVVRAAVIEGSAPAVAKQAKRALSDLQNEMLAALRDGSKTSVDTQAFAATITSPLADAWSAGAKAVGRPGKPGEARTERVTQALESEVFAVLEGEISQAVADSGDAVEAVRLVFRRIRPRLVGLTQAALAAAFLDGMLDTLPEGCPVRWVPGDGPDDAKHAAVNGAVEVRLGAEFPTGEVRPDPLGTCRCLIVPLHA